MIRHKWVASLVAAVAFASAAPAFAAEPATANAFQIGLGFRYGFEMEEGDFNPWGTGLGIDAGYTLPSAVYVGGVFDYFFGETQESAGFELSANIWQLMAEGGYDIGAGEFVVRPKLGAGLASFNGEFCGPGPTGGESCTDDSETNFAIAPGVTFMYLGSSISLSLDLRYDMIFAEDEQLNALIFSAGIGF